MTSLVVGLAQLLSFLITIYTTILLIRVILSWVNPDPRNPPRNPIVRLLYQVTEPILGRVRRVLPASFFQFGLDVTPIIVFIGLILIDKLIVGGLYRLALSLSH